MIRKKGYSLDRQKLVLMAAMAFLTGFSVSVAQLGNQPDSLRSRLGEESISESLQRQNITESKLEELKKMGFDLRGQLLHGDGRDERVAAALSDMVLIGKVLNTIDLPGPQAEPFHSKVNVQIMELLRGPKQTGDTIQVLRRGGPITDYHGGNVNGGPVTMSVSIEPTMQTGETVVLFLTDVYHDSYFTRAYKSFFSRQHPDLPNPSYWVGSCCKHDIVGSVVRVYDRKIPLDVIRSETREIGKIVDEPSAK